MHGNRAYSDGTYIIVVGHIVVGHSSGGRHSGWTYSAGTCSGWTYVYLRPPERSPTFFL